MSTTPLAGNTRQPTVLIMASRPAMMRGQGVDVALQVLRACEATLIAGCERLVQNIKAGA